MIPDSYKGYDNRHVEFKSKISFSLPLINNSFTIYRFTQRRTL